MYNTPVMIRMKEKKMYLYIVGVVGVLVGIVVLVYFSVGVTGVNDQWEGYERNTVFFDTGQTLEVVVSDTQEKRVQGLSDSPNLAEDTGMLFIFENERNNPFWMKDMNYSIDIFWFDNEYQLTQIERDVSPDTFPEVFGGDIPSRYVLETNVGQLLDMKNIQIQK